MFDKIQEATTASEFSDALRHFIDEYSEVQIELDRINAKIDQRMKQKRIKEQKRRNAQQQDNSDEKEKEETDEEENEEEEEEEYEEHCFNEPHTFAEFKEFVDLVVLKASDIPGIVNDDTARAVADLISFLFSEKVKKNDEITRLLPSLLSTRQARDSLFLPMLEKSSSSSTLIASANALLCLLPAGTTQNKPAQQLFSSGRVLHSFILAFRKASSPDALAAICRCVCRITFRNEEGKKYFRTPLIVTALSFSLCGTTGGVAKTPESLQVVCNAICNILSSSSSSSSSSQEGEQKQEQEQADGILDLFINPNISSSLIHALHHIAKTPESVEWVCQLINALNAENLKSREIQNEGVYDLFAEKDCFVHALIKALDYATTSASLLQIAIVIVGFTLDDGGIAVFDDEELILKILDRMREGVCSDGSVMTRSEYRHQSVHRPVCVQWVMNALCSISHPESSTVETVRRKFLKHKTTLIEALHVAVVGNIFSNVDGEEGSARYRKPDADACSAVCRFILQNFGHDEEIFRLVFYSTLDGIEKSNDMVRVLENYSGDDMTVNQALRMFYSNSHDHCRHQEKNNNKQKQQKLSKNDNVEEEEEHDDDQEQQVASSSTSDGGLVTTVKELKTENAILKEKVYSLELDVEVMKNQMLSMMEKLKEMERKDKLKEKAKEEKKD